MTRSRRPIVTVALAAALLLVAVGQARAAGVSLSTDRDGRLVVRTPHYAATVDPARGGRLSGFAFGGLEATRVDPDGRGGLLAERHTGGAACEVLNRRSTDEMAELEMAAQAGDLYVARRYRFYADRPAIELRLAFENRSALPLSGSDAPEFESLALPGGSPRRTAGGELYCLARNRAAEVLSADEFVAACHADPGPPLLRWLAVTDPVQRRAVGFVLGQSGCRPVAPALLADGAALVGWRGPSLPAGTRTEFDVLLVPLQGFAALAELNADFAADVALDAGGDGAALKVQFVPLSPDLREASLITRTYDAAGREAEPADPLVFDDLEPLGLRTVRAALPPGAAAPAWTVHEVYSLGRLVGQFAVRLGGEATEPPAVGAEPAPPTRRELADGAGPDMASADWEAARGRGFAVWQSDGARPGAEADRVEMALPRGGQRTTFLALRALRDLEGVRFSLAGTPDSTARAAVPPAAVALWCVHEEADGPAWLGPATEQGLKAGETAWFALTADASGLRPGRYGGRLVFSAGPAAWEGPLALTVADRAAPDPAGAGLALWYLGPDGPWQPGRLELARLRGYGVAALTVPEPALADVLGDAEELGYGMLGACRAGGVLPPAGASPGLLVLAQGEPTWLVEAAAALPEAAGAAARAGYAPAVEVEALAAAPGAAAVITGSLPEGEEVRGLIESGGLAAGASVWLGLDETGADWRRAAVQARAAFWAAAFRGLAGVAVRCDPPRPEVDRELAIWHVLRDARQEAALWREVLGDARAVRAAQRAESEASDAAVLAAEQAEGVVGTAEHCLLRVQAGPGLPRVAAADEAAPPLAGFEVAYRRALDVAERLAPMLAPAGPARQLYWQGIPLVEGGRAQWTIVAPAGEEPWQTGLALQRAVAERTGVELPMQRSLPESGGRGYPALIFLVDGAEGLDALPAECRAAVSLRPGRATAEARLECGAVLVLVQGERGLGAALRVLRARPSAFATAGDVR